MSWCAGAIGGPAMSPWRTSLLRDRCVTAAKAWGTEVGSDMECRVADGRTIRGTECTLMFRGTGLLTVPLVTATGAPSTCTVSTLMPRRIMVADRATQVPGILAEVAVAGLWQVRLRVPLLRFRMG